VLVRTAEYADAETVSPGENSDCFRTFVNSRLRTV